MYYKLPPLVTKRSSEDYLGLSKYVHM